MAEDWFADVQKHVADADEGVVKKIVSYLGIALRNRDSSLVSFSDPEEVGRVRERFLRKKLGLTDPEGVLDKGLDAVRDMMAGDRTKNRVTVYYLLADWFGKLDLFGGKASAPGSFSFGSAAGAAAAGAATYGAADLAAGSAASGPAEVSGSGAAATAAGAGAAAVAASTPTSASSRPVDTGQDNRATTYAAANVHDVDDAGGGGFPSWLKWLLLIAALLLLFLLVKSCMAGRDVDNAGENTAVTETMSGTDANATTETVDANAAVATAVPAGSGVVAGQQAGKPMLTVYFDSGKSEVSNQLAAQAATLKAHLDANAGTNLAVSGYNDPSGNAALNAELSKKRAQGVAAALTAAGIPETAIELVKPADTTSATITPEQARRVEVTIK